jgi:MFS family permease
MSTHAGSSSTGQRDGAPARPSVGPHRHLAGLLLVLVMGAGSIVMWLVSPLAWLWIASRMTSSSQPSIGPYLLVLVGMTVTAVVIGKLLGSVNRAHMRVTGRLSDKREHATWNRSMRGERTSSRDRGVLDSVMMISVAGAFVLFGIWFFAFAGSSLPS